MRMPWSVGRETPDAASLSVPRRAEVARTTVAAASSLRIGTLALTAETVRHAVDEDGSLLVVPAAGTPEHGFGLSGGRTRLTVQAIATDVCPVPLPDRVRSTVVLVGAVEVVGDEEPIGTLGSMLLAQGRTWQPLLRVVPKRVALHERRLGACSAPLEVDLGAYREAVPDPLLELEGEWLAHLDEGHADALGALAAAAGAPVPRPRAVALNRHGLRLRCGDRDVEVAFGRPVGCGCDLAEAFEELLDATGAPGRPGCGN